MKKFKAKIQTDNAKISLTGYGPDKESFREFLKGRYSLTDKNILSIKEYD